MVPGKTAQPRDGATLGGRIDLDDSARAGWSEDAMKPGSGRHVNVSKEKRKIRENRVSRVLCFLYREVAQRCRGSLYTESSPKIHLPSTCSMR